MEIPLSLSLFDAFPDAALVADRDGLISFANTAFADLSGRETVELATVPVADVLTIDGDWCECGKSGRRFDFSMMRRSETEMKGWLVARQFQLDDGSLAYLLVVKSKTVLDADLLNEALAFAVNVVPYPFTLWDGNGRLMCFNDHARRFYEPIKELFFEGQDRETLLRAAFVHGVYGQSLNELAYSRKEIIGLSKIGNSDGVPIVNVAETAPGRWVKATAFFSKGGWGAAFFEDISELKQAQLALDEQSKLYELILENVPDFVVVADRDLRVTFVNKSYATVDGRSAAEMVGEPCDIIRDGSYGKPFESLVRQARPETPTFFFDQGTLDANGKRSWIRWRTLVLFDEGTMSGLIKVGRDITLEYEQEVSLRQQSSELKKKNESLEQFAAVVSHDLKAPLRHIAIFAEMISEETSKQNYENLPTYATQVHKSAVRMDRVIRRLLEYSQIAYKVVSLQRFDLADIVIQSVQNLESQIEAVRAEILASDLPQYFGDPDLLRQVMQNLIGNAVKYGRPGVKPRIRIYSATEGSNLVIYVEDNGIGIDPKYADSIFTAFQRLHKDESVYDGFGIGLALCKQIVESHYGSISLDTTYKNGARFVVKLPLNGT